MGYWKTKLLPQIKKVFGNDVAKKAAAVEACKSFDASKDEVSKEFEDKKAELQPKVLEIFEASSAELKALVKDPKEGGLKKHSAEVQSFLDKLDKIDFPGSKVAQACSKFGPGLASGPVKFVFEKVSTFVVTEEKPREIEAPAAAAAAAVAAEETSDVKETSEADKEIATVTEEKASEVAATVAANVSPVETAPPKLEQTQAKEPPQ